MSLKTKNISLLSKSEVNNSELLIKQKKTAIDNSISNLRYLLLPLSYAFTIALHACVKEFRKPIADTFFNTFLLAAGVGNFEDRTRCYDIFRFCLPILINEGFIRFYNYLKTRYSYKNAFFIFNGVSIALFTFWYVGPVLHSEQYKNGMPLLGFLINSSFMKNSPTWLKAGLSNVFISGIFHSICEVLPQFFINDFWSYLSSIRSHLNVLESDKLEEGINANSMAAQAFVNIPIMLVGYFPICSMSRFTHIAYFVMLAIIATNILLRSLCVNKMSIIDVDFATKAKANIKSSHSSPGIISSINSVGKIPGCLGLALSSTSYFIISIISESIFSSFISEGAVNINSNIKNNKPNIFLCLSKDASDNKERIKLFINAAVAMLTSIATLVCNYIAVNLMKDDEYANFVSQLSISIASAIVMLVGILAQFKVITIGGYIIALTALLICVLRSVKYVLMDSIRHRLFNCVSKENKVIVRTTVDAHVIRIAKGPMATPVNSFSNFLSNLISNSKDIDVNKYYNFSVGSGILVLIGSYISFTTSRKSYQAAAYSRKNNISFEDAYKTINSSKKSV